ncbi:mucin-4-like isoform X2 [Mya arenaria]|uniref:mucin-4-like isoform X2 n=1 Tax=Mya arenaria TaxID=6604 RepID=UPI0022E05BE3|nr:mucin-4-like isoform X2 [Mya arenaria]
MEAMTDVLERKIEGLSRLLAEERQTSRQNKMAASRLQRELSRAKSHDRPATGKEHLSRELEHERMLRVEAERRLRDVTRESESCHARLESLQTDFLKMEGQVREMVQYKTKIDQLKQEKSSLNTTYEANVEKFKGHITELERENMVLLNEVKKLESQMSSKPGGQDRYRLLMERLRMIEGENSSLVLENEEQRGQYEKCLDEIANQVVQALLAQKMLREECIKLQDHVQELEVHNRHLYMAYTNRGSQDGGAYMHGSIDSLHSMFSEQTTDVAGGPQMSSPPPWLRERLPGDRRSLISFSGSVTSTPENELESLADHRYHCRTEIETEFPATPSSPKSKHVSIMERKNETKRSSSTSSLLPTKIGPNRQRTRSTSSLHRARGLSVGHTQNESQDSGITPQASSASPSLSSHSDILQLNKSSTQLPGFARSVSVPSSQQSQQSDISHITQGNQSSVMSTSSSSSSSSSTSRIPVIPCARSKEDLQLRRNSLKAEYSIRLGSQSPAHRNSPSPKPGASQSQTNIPSAKPSSLRPPSQGHRSTGKGQGQDHPRSPSLSSGRSHSAGSRIPSVSGKQTKVIGKDGSNKVKPGLEGSKTFGSVSKYGSEGNKSSTGPVSKLVPPKSPSLRHSGIKTTLKTDTGQIKSVKKTSESAKSKSSQSANVSNASPHSNLKTVYSISTVSSSRVLESRNLDVSEPVLPARGHKPVGNFPIMGLTTLSHTSPKSEESPLKIYANVSQVPVSFSSGSVSRSSDKISESTSNNVITSTTPSLSNSDKSVTVKSGESQNAGTYKNAGYFYDYSDEDSDCHVTRRVSKDLSIASSVSLEELLDKTLENMTTPNSEFSSGYLMFNSTQTLEDSSPVCAAISEKLIRNNDSSRFSGKLPSSEQVITVANVNQEYVVEHRHDAIVNTRLTGKPDIVKDTENSEQRNLQKSMPISEIPGSSMPGYRAKRPKSLILGAKEKKFLYCEYGSSSSPDSSEGENWTCKFSYAKNAKEQVIKTKVAQSVKSGEAKVIESPHYASIQSKDSSGDKQKTVDKTGSSGIAKPSGLKKPSKIPPPVASKPAQRKSSIPKADHEITRPKSVEICVNTALSVTRTEPLFVDGLNIKDIAKAESERSLNRKSKSENTDITSNSTFEEIKVERSGSKDDGYSTMSSDIQPEHLEKYSDAFESSTNSNDARNSNLSLSSQNSYSSEDRLSGHGSLGRVKAMKLKFELDNHKSDTEKSPTKSPPPSPAKSLLKSPKSVSEKVKANISNDSNQGDKIQSKMVPVTSKLPKPKSGIPCPKETGQTNMKTKCAIPVPKSKPNVLKSEKPSHKVEIQIPVKVDLPVKDIVSDQVVQRKSFPITNPNYITSSPVRPSADEPSLNARLSPITPNIPPPHIIQQSQVPTTSFTDQFNQLSCFEKIEFLKDSYDSNSSLSDRGSDLTSLHISEDNILSDIPEEKDGYESSVGIKSENTSFSSIPTLTCVKKPPQPSPGAQHHSSSHHASRATFSTTLKRHWSSCEGLVRAAVNSDYEKQKSAKHNADYEELYGGCLNIETLLERCSSESDLYTRGDKPAVTLLPQLRSPGMIQVDEIAVEERVQAILKFCVLRQISENVASADRDGESFTSFVELLMQRGHVLQTPSPAQELNNMSVSNFSSKGQNSVHNSFGSEERSETELPPLGDDQKRFNSNFYSLCNTGSNRSISEKADSVCADTNSQNQDNKQTDSPLVHTCRKGDKSVCKKCENLRNVNEFDNISKQIECLSRTVNELHKSLSSLNSENDSGSESNEGDVNLANAIGNKDIDGYHWVEDELFLSPYEGEIILGTSPFSKTGASCDWINDYADDEDHVEEMGGSEALLEEDPTFDIPVSMDSGAKTKLNPMHMHNSDISNCFDEDGNFDSASFISQRLQKEEERLKSLDLKSNKAMLFTQDIDISAPIQKLRSSMTSSRSHPLKEDMRTTPEKDIDDTELFAYQERLGLHAGSHESLDDNIGVDSVMCHRLLGGKGAPVPGGRPALDFTQIQFMRYGDAEKQALSAFEFLQDMTSSAHSDQSVGQKVSHDMLFRMEGNMSDVARSNMIQMNQSTTSNEEKISPVRKQRRKIKLRNKKDQSAVKNQGKAKTRQFSSTSNDESNDDYSDGSSSDNYLVQEQSMKSKKMTYL